MHLSACCSVKGTAEIMECSVKKVKKLIKKGSLNLKSTCMSKEKMVPMDDIQRLLRNKLDKTVRKQKQLTNSLLIELENTSLALSNVAKAIIEDEMEVTHEQFN